MSVSYGFYNSQNHDRRYNAEQFSRMFNMLINDGVFASYGGRMMVYQTNPIGLKVVVKTGFAWFDSTWTLNDSDLILNIDAPNAVYNRIDTVVLEVKSANSYRINAIKIVKGTPASSPVAPTLTNTNDLHQYPLADIVVPMGTSGILQSNITNRIGTSRTPWVTGILQTVDLTSMYAKWEEDFANWMSGQESDWETTKTQINGQLQNILTSGAASIKDVVDTGNRLIRGYEEAFQEFIANSGSSFDTKMVDWDMEFRNWFSSIQETLEGDVAAILTVKVADLERRMAAVEDVNTTQGSDISALKSADASLSDRITTVQANLTNGLESKLNTSAIATQQQAETGTLNQNYMTPLRTAQAIKALTPPSDSFKPGDFLIATTKPGDDWVRALGGHTWSYPFSGSVFDLATAKMIGRKYAGEVEYPGFADNSFPTSTYPFSSFPSESSLYATTSSVRVTENGSTYYYKEVTLLWDRTNSASMFVYTKEYNKTEIVNIANGSSNRRCVPVVFGMNDLAITIGQNAELDTSYLILYGINPTAASPTVLTTNIGVFDEQVRFTQVFGIYQPTPGEDTVLSIEVLFPKRNKKSLYLIKLKKSTSGQIPTTISVSKITEMPAGNYITAIQDGDRLYYAPEIVKHAPLSLSKVRYIDLKKYLESGSIGIHGSLTSPLSLDDGLVEVLRTLDGGYGTSPYPDGALVRRYVYNYNTVICSRQSDTNYGNGDNIARSYTSTSDVMVFDGDKRDHASIPGPFNLTDLVSNVSSSAMASPANNGAYWYMFSVSDKPNGQRAKHVGLACTWGQGTSVYPSTPDVRLDVVAYSSILIIQAGCSIEQAPERQHGILALIEDYTQPNGIATSRIKSLAAYHYSHSLTTAQYPSVGALPRSVIPGSAIGNYTWLKIHPDDIPKLRSNTARTYVAGAEEQEPLEFDAERGIFIDPNPSIEA